jgi:hypothetical protein
MAKFLEEFEDGYPEGGDPLARDPDPLFGARLQLD